MKNVTMQRKGNELTLKIDLSQSQGKSKSGKTEIIATSAGNAAVPGDEGIRIGVNVYK